MPQFIAGHTENSVNSKVLTYPELREFERDNLRKALEQTDWKVAGTGGVAELLDANPTTLASRIKRFNLSRRVIDSR